MRRTLVLAGIAGTLLVPGHASASGITAVRFGGEHGTPMTSNATAMYYNPAGIAVSEGGHAYADVTLALRHSSFEHATSATDAPMPIFGAGANDGRATLANVVASPFFGVTYRLGALGLGASYYTPYGGQSAWRKNGAFRNDARLPGAVDGVQRWYSIDGELRSSFATLAGAYDFGRVKLGLSVNLIDTIANTLRARDPTGSNDVRNEGRSWLDARSLDFSIGAGVIVDVVPRVVRAGLSYQSRPGITSEVRASGTLHTVFASGGANDNKVDFLTALPDVFRGGVSVRPMEKVELRVFGDYQRWSAMKNQCLVQPGADCTLNADGSAGSPAVVLNQRRDWHDTFGVRVGGSYWTSERVELFAGAGFTSNAIPDRTLEPALQDYQTFTGAAGGRFAVLSRLHLAATYTQVVYLSRDTTGKSMHPTLGAASRGPDSGGKYSQQNSVLNVGVDFAF